MHPQAQVAARTGLCPTSSSSGRQHTLIGSCLIVLCSAHVEAITADVLRCRLALNGQQCVILALHLCPSKLFMSLSVYISILWFPLQQSLQRSHLFPFIWLFFQERVERALGCSVEDRSESSVLLWAVWQAVPQTPGVWQPYQLLRPRTQAGKHRALPWLIITTSHTNRYTSRVSAITVIVVLLAS